MGMETLHLHRVFNAPPERVYRAFLEAEALSKWLAPNGYTAVVHTLEPVAGGEYHITLNNFKTGDQLSVKGKYLELLPNQLIRYSDQLCDDSGGLTTEFTEKTIHFDANFMGTEITIEQTGFSSHQPKEILYLEWQQSLSLLELLVNNDH